MRATLALDGLNKIQITRIMGNKKRGFSRKESRCCFSGGGSQFDYILFWVSFNPLSTNPTKWSNTPNNLSAKVDELFEYA